MSALRYFKITIFLMLLVIASVEIAYSGNVIIKGKAINENDTIAYLFKYTDMITYKDQLLSQGRIDKNGNFELSLNTDQTIVAFIEIKKVRGAIFIEPGGTYNVVFPQVDRRDLNENTNFHLKKEKVILSINDNNPRELNNMIINFNLLFSDFIEKNFNRIYRQRTKQPIDSLRLIIKNTFKDTSNDYFNNYIKYRIATVEMPAQIKSRKKIVNEYFSNKPILYENIEYMSFFNSFYDRYWEICRNSDEISSAVNNSSGLTCKKIMDIMNDSVLLKDKRIKELVLIKELNDYYLNKKFKNNNINNLLTDISNMTSIPEHKHIVNDIINNFSALKPGSKAPAFELRDINDKPFKLSDFKGKYVYINFWKSSFVPCLSEMKLMEKMYNAYRDKVVFISISADKNPRDMISLVKKYKWRWIFAHSGANEKIIDDYEVLAYPTYILIDKNGNIIQAPADSPTGNIETFFFSISKKKPTNVDR
ncbi:MAG: TlpA disulfide reductase family protein [Bacteroidota bacterium]|nr:TlpA disulfide reductase family protein [Bacteroidota bacterium]